MIEPARVGRRDGRRPRRDPVSPGTIPRLLRLMPGAGMGWLVAALFSASMAADEPVVLRVSAPDGPLPPTREEIAAAAEAGVESFAVKLEDVALVRDDDLLALIEAEIADLITAAVPDAEIVFERCDETCAAP